MAAKDYIKYLVIFFNLLFSLLGLALVGIGAWAEHTVGPYVKLSSVNYITGPRIMIALGIILAIMVFVGCLGALKESRCMLIVFVITLLILLLMEITVVVLAFHLKDEIQKSLREDIKKNIVKYPTENLKVVDDLQSKLECCGGAEPSDWTTNADYNRTNDLTSVPDSCCKQKYYAQDCGRGQLVNKTKIYTDGCYSKLKGKIEDNLVPTGALAITILVIQILGIAFAIALIYHI